MLVVEDDASQADPLLKLLRRKLPQGSTVAQAASQSEALECVLHGGFDVALVDLGLPDSHEVEAVVALRAASADLAITVLSAQEEESTVQSALKAGADDYFVKGELAVSGVARAVTSAVERKRFTRALATALDSRRRIMDLSMDVICTLDAAGCFAEVGAACERVWGYTREELIGRNSTQWIAAADQSKTDSFLEAVRGGAPAQGFENRFVRKDGSEMDTMWSAFWSTTDRLMYCVARDVTERKHAEEAQVRLAAIVESSDDAIVGKNLEGIITTWNPGAEKIFGYTAAEAIGQSTKMLFPSEDVAQEAEILVRVGRGENVKHFDAVRVRKDGTQVNVSVTISPVTDLEGKIIGASKIARDITARKQAEEALRESEARFRTMANSMPQLGWIAHADGFIYWYNQRWYDYTGTTPEAMEGWGWQSVHDPEVLPRVMAEWTAAIATGKAFEMEFPLRGTDGTFRRFLTLAVPLKDAAGHVVQWFGTNTDITAQIEIEDALRESEERFAGAFQSGPIAMMLTRVSDSRIVETNETFEKMSGYSKAECLGRTTVELGLISAEEREKSGAVVREKGLLRDVEIGFYPRAGEPRVVLVSVEPVTLQGEPHFIVTMLDITARKQAEEALRKSEASLAAAQRRAKIGNWEMDLVNRTSTWSTEMFRIFQRDQSLGSPPFDEGIEKIYPEDRESFQCSFDQAIKDRRELKDDVRIVRSDGNIRWLELRGEVICDEAGQPSCMIGTSQDITERKRQEETLRATIESALDCIITIDESDTIIEFNPAAEQTFGWSRAEAIGRTVSETIIPPQFREAHARGLARLLATGEQRLIGKRIEVTAMRAGGAEFPIELTIVQIGTDHPQRFTAFMRDITERVSAREKLEAQEEQYRVLFETNPSAMWVYELETLRILAVNDAAVEQYGYSRDEFLVRSLYDLRAPSHAEALTKAISSEGSVSRYAGTWSHQRKDGSTIFVDVYSSPTDFEGTPARIAVLVDVTERKRAEEALNRSERDQRELAAELETERSRLVAAQGLARVGDWEADFVQGTRSWSAETYRIFEVPRDECAPSHERFMEIVHPEDRAAVEAASAASLSQGAPTVNQHRLLMPDGRIKFIEQRWLVFQNEEGEAVRATGTVQDITERNEAQIALRKEQEFLAAVVDNVSDGIVSCDAQGVIALFNGATRQFHGLPAEPIPADEWAEHFDLYLPDGKTLMSKEQIPLFRALEEGFVKDAEMVIAPREGTPRRILASGQAFFNEQGEKMGAVVAMHDVTEREKAERTMRAQAEMLNLAQDAIAIRGYDDRIITYWNKGAERLYGWTAEEAIGQPVDILYGGRGDNEAAKQTLEASDEYQGEVHQIARDGRSVIVNVRKNVMRNSDGTPRSVLSIATDITEHKKLESQFLRAQRLESIGTLASGVAHDLNNILSPILMSVPLLRTPLSDEGREKLLSLVEQSAERGAAVVKQVLTFARGADGEKVLVQPCFLMKEIAQIAEETFPTNITVRSECPDDLWLISGDATELHQVLLNLCVNARDAMPAGGRLSINAENLEVDAHYASMTPGAHAGPHVLLTVSDTGTGIPPSVIEKIFDPFFTTKQEGKGTGLGLSTVLGIVKNHGGVVNAYSTPKGTTFRVLLPAAPGTYQASADADLADLPRGRGETILIVDDDPVIREVAQALLAQSGYIVLTADDGPAALAIFARRSAEIRLVMTDFAMPLMSGMTLARALRKMDASTKVVISTGRDEDCNPAEAKSIGIEATLAKPYTQEKLLRTLDRLLHAAAPGIS